MGRSLRDGGSLTCGWFAKDRQPLSSMMRRSAVVRTFFFAETSVRSEEQYSLRKHTYSWDNFDWKSRCFFSGSPHVLSYFYCPSACTVRM
jgi:hypothetical protein